VIWNLSAAETLKEKEGKDMVICCFLILAVQPWYLKWEAAERRMVGHCAVRSAGRRRRWPFKIISMVPVLMA